jgi:hypothetical protein
MDLQPTNGSIHTAFTNQRAIQTSQTAIAQPLGGVKISKTHKMKQFMNNQANIKSNEDNFMFFDLNYSK